MSVQAYVFKWNPGTGCGGKYEGRGGHLTDDIQMALVTANPGRRANALMASGQVKAIPVKIVPVSGDGS